MATSTLSENEVEFKLKFKKTFIFISFLILSTVSFAQPAWFGGTPTLTPHALSEDFGYGINQVGKVYVILINFNYSVPAPTSLDIKNAAIAGPAGGRISTWVINVPLANINQTFSINALNQIGGNINLISNHDYTFYFVAENSVGTLQAAPVRIMKPTLVCPHIDLLTGFTQPVVCINKGTVATFQVVTLSPNADLSGIYKGTQWTLDWGDGTTAAYTSTADNDLPPLALRTHTYSTITDCNYVFSNDVKNPCGETRAVQYVAVVHGRDIPSDGDGLLQIIDDATGSTVINVCAGTQTTVTLRDNSIWNCQNPVLPGGLTAVPNTDPRNIEWLYGRDPGGAITNTITGAVDITTLGNAPQASGRLSPIAAPGTTSEAITIPATCVAGQYFRVYLKNWNKCNWTDPEQVNTFIDINVIAAPPAPTVANRTICFGDPNTLTVTSPPVGTITWYSDALLTTIVGTGVNFNPAQTAAGTYNFWVTDQSTTGLMCKSLATPVTLTIREALVQPGAITGPAQVCSNQAGVIFSVVAVPPVMPFGGPTQYVWSVPAGWTITAGQGTRQITVTVNAAAGIQTISLVDQYTTVPNCPSPSRSTTTNLNPVATINSANSKTVCDVTPLAYTATSATPGCTFAWTRAVVAGISNGAGAGATALINESLDNTTASPVNAIYVITPTINGCTGTPFNLTVTVNPTAVITSAAAKTVCNTTALAYTSTSSTASATFAWSRAVVAGISNGAGAGAAALINESLNNTSTAPVDAVYIITPSYGGCAGTPFNLTVTVNPTAVITSAAALNICDNVPLGYTATSSTAGASFAWTRAAVAGVSNVAGAGGAAFINESLNNTVTAPVAVTYIITPSYGGCAGTAFNLVVTVNPTAVITSAAANTVCDNTPVAYTSTSSTAGATYSWTRAVVAGISNAAGAGAVALINESLDNTTAAPVNAVYVITPTINGCNGTPFNLTVTVNPSPVVTSAATKTVCDVTPLAYTATSSSAGATFAWTRAVVAGISNGAGVGAAALINESLDNTTNAAVNATYIITPSFGGCAGTPFNLVVTVNPTTVITSAAAANVCDNTPLGYTATSSTVGATFAWTRAVVGGIINGAGAGATALINESLDNNTTAPVAVTYIITPGYAGCDGTPFNLVITVNPTSVITSANSKIVCSNTPVGYNATSSTVGASFSWTRAVVAGISNGAGAGASSVINESLINTTGANVNAIYIITPSINGCPGTPFNFTVTVHPQFTLAQFHDDASICNNTATNINVVMTGGTSPYTVNYTRNGVAQAAWVGYVSGTNMTTGLLLANTTYAITSVTDAFGCPAQSLGTPILVTVGSSPTTATLTGSGNTCFGTSSTIRSVITGGAPPYTLVIAGYPLSPVVGYTSGTNINLGALAAGLHSYTLTSVTDACGNTVPVGGLPAAAYTFTVFPIPALSTTLTPAAICSNTAFSYVPASATPGTTFNWNRATVAGITPAGPTSGANNPNETLVNSTANPIVVTYVYTLLANGCSNTQNVTVTVNPTPTLTTTLTPGAICSNTAFSYVPASATAGTTFNWTRATVAGITPVGPTSGANNPNETLVNTTANPIVVTYIYTLAANGCNNVQNVTVTVKPAPALSTTLTPAAICSNTAFSYAPASATAGTTFNWTRATIVGITPVGPTAGPNNPNETLVNTTTGPVVVTYVYTLAANGCSNVQNVTVTVNPRPVLSTTLIPAAICSNTAFSYAPASGTAGTTFNWSRATVAGITPAGPTAGTNNPNETLVNTTANPIVVTYAYTLAANGCSNVQNVTVTVNPTPTLTTTLTPAAICSNTAFSYAPASATAGTTFNWTRATIAGITPVGPTAGANNPNETLVNTTTAPIVVTYVYTLAANGCSNVQNVTVTVNPSPVLSTTLTPAAICSNTAFSYAPASGTAGTTFNWNRAIVAGITPVGPTSGTNNPNETLVNTTASPIVVTYAYTLAANGCNNVQNVTVTVNPTPALSTTLTPAAICSNTAFSYAPASATAGTTFNWTRATVAGITPAGPTAGANNPNETLVNTTTAPIVVTYAYTLLANGCNNVQNVTVTVNPTPVLSSTLTPLPVCSNIPVSYIPASATAGTTFNWTRATVAGITPVGPTAGANNPNETLVNSTTSPVTVTYVYTLAANGCNNVQNVTIAVNPAGQVDQPGNQVICNTANTALVNFSTVNTGGVTTYNWTNSVPGIGLAASGSGNSIPVFAAVNLGVAPVTASIVVTPSFTNNTIGCAGSTKTFTITVNPTPKLSTTLTPADVCSNTVFSYPAASATAGTTFNWSRAAVAGVTPAGPTAGVNNPNETLRNITSAPIAVTYQYTLAANGCSNIQNVVVNINPEPVITPGQNQAACSGNALSYKILMDNFANPADNVTFTWPAPVRNPVNPAFTGGTARPGPSSADITDTFTNTMGALGTATYTVTPYKNGCAGTPVTVVITVGSEPVLDPGLNAFACSNTPIGLILKEAAGSVTPTYYNIISKTVAGGLTDVGNAVIPNGTAPANYLSTDRFTNTSGINKTVVYRVQPILAPNCIGAAVDVTITIRPQPVIFPAQSKTVCSRETIGKEILLAPPNVPAGSLFNWPVPVISDGSVQGTAGVNVVADPAGTLHINDQIHNYSAAPIQAVYTVTPVSQFGCAGTPTPVIITINPEPVPQPISGRDKICVTDKNIVYNVSAVGGSTFHWTVDPAVGTKTFDFNTNAILIDAAAVAGAGNITVYETNSYICSGDISTLPVQVYEQPAAEVIGGNAIVCANSTQVYNVTNRPGSLYSWTVPGGAAIIGDPAASSITVIFANVGGTISVRETNAAGCITNHTPKAITVNPLPTATISGGATICDGASVNLTVDFTGVGPYTFTYALNGVPQAPIATAADPYTLNVTSAGTYTIVNVSDANCTNNGTGTTTVSFFPKPTGTLSGTAEMCRGGSATLTVTFTGVAPYTFTYTDGTTPVTVVGHLTNVYTFPVSPLVNTTYTLVSLTDGNLCVGVVSGTAVISVNIPPALTLTGTNLICYGVSTGAVNMAIAGGTGPFGYSWTGPGSFTANTQNISALAEGYYAVVVTDSKGCQGNANITLTQPAVLNGSAAGTNITCFGANDGTITISGSAGGAGTFEYTINGGGLWQASPNFTALMPGTYNVMMRDAVNPTCIKVLNAALLLTQPAVLNATVIKTDINCFGANNGSIVISAPTGGYGTYGYSINGGATWQGSGNFTNLTAASYDVRIRDAAQTACFVTLNPVLVITEPAVMTATVNNTNITCFGSTDGTITVSAPAGGHGTYEYSINGGGSWQVSGNFTALVPGSYNVQIRDAAFTSCYIILNPALVITQPAVLQANVASTNITCNAASDGIINITAPLGGYGTYEYSIDGGTGWQAAGLFNGLAPGTYDVRIRDAAHTLCFIILNPGLQITEPLALNALVIDTDITCFGANDGVIQVTNSAGGYGTYDYSINGGTTWQATGLFPGLSAATYNVQIRDRAHITCVKVLDAAVVISEPAILNATVNHTNITCFAANDGTITISAPTGGYGSYGYSINGGTSWQGSGNFTNLAPGTYNIRIRDAVNTGCIIALNPAVVITEPVVLSATVARTNVNCYGAADGTITINGSAGGSGTYEYTINGGSTWQASNNFSGLIPGFYNVKIRDAVNTACIVTINGSLSITEPAVLNANVAKTNITCNGADNGTITITAPTGGYGTYEYTINGGALWQASGSFTGLTPGTYNVQIRDAAHATCVIILNNALVVTQPAVLAATVTPTMISCFGASNGVIAITAATGGYGTYEYSINGGTTWSGLGNFTNLTPNTYDVRIRDAANTACVMTLNAALIITQPPVLAAVITKTDIGCFGASNGTITISAPTGGYGTYEYSINGGGSWQASGNFIALSPGNYNVQIRDAAHISCVIVLNNAVQITQPAILNAVITPTNVSCNGANNGIINITAPTGGYGTYEYSVDGGTGWQASGLFNGLAPLTYDVRIRDAANISCTITLNNALTITEPAALNANVASTNVTCFGANNGTITITSPVGGYGTYEYSNNGGTSWQATGNFINLVPASYNVQIRDKAHIGCVIVLNNALLITEPPVLSATVASVDITCFGANNGIITITNPLGGYGTYSYTVNGGASWQALGIFTNLSPGSYDVRIRDAANTACIMILDPARIIMQPAILAASVAKTDVTCANAGDGTITVSAPAGGYGTYEYSVNGGTSWQASGNFVGLMPGFYNVQIRDAAHQACVIILNGSLQITQPAPLSANLVKTNVTCIGANDGTITISSPTGGYGTYEYSINGGTSWQASGTFTALIPGSYNVQMRDAAHITCIQVLNPAFVVTEPLVMTATVTPTMVSCNGANDGIISITAPAGGYGTYQYSINGGITWQPTGTYTNLTPGNFDVRIRDAVNTGCVVILNPALAITQPLVLAATVNQTNITCFGGSDGIISITAPTGGYGTYEYSVNGGGSWQAVGNFTLLAPGNYNVQIRDAAHTSCVIILNPSLAITQPSILTAVVTPTNVSCNGANNGIINITAPAGGSGTYEYSNTGGAGWQASGLFSGLVPGTFDVRIRDAANTACVITLNPTLLITEPPVITALVASTNVTCNGANDGTITITNPAGGYGTYDFSINGGTSWQATGTFVNLAPGSFNVQIRDRAHAACVIILNPALAITEPVVLSATLAHTEVSCFGSGNGTITITNPLGGYGTYSYSINGGTTWQPSGTFTNLAPAVYNVQIRDAAHISCIITLDGALQITQPPVLSATVANTNVTCSGSADGSITITSPLGGYGTYEYTVTGGTAWQASGNFAGLMPGFYNVQIRDAAHISCVVILNGSLQITEPPVLSAFVSKTNVACNGGSDGSITVMGATGGYGTYEYSINGGTGWQASGTFTGLAPATYDVRIRDAAHTGCVKILDNAVVISQPAILNATVTPTMVTCFGANDGRIVITNPTGGYGTYQYSVNGGTTWQGSGTFTNLSPAAYNVEIRDAANTTCIIQLDAALAITQPAVLVANLAHTNVTCFGGNDGTISITAPAGGSGSYEYSINGGGSWQASGSFTLLSPGSYNVIIRDALHTTCIIVLNNSYAITQPAVLAATVTKTDVTCQGANDGTITISAPAGGSGSYEYSLDGGLSWLVSGNFVNLVPSTYDIRMRDAVNPACTVILYPNMIITEPVLLGLTTTGDILLDCNGDMDGTGTFYGSGGSLPYTFHVISNTTGATLAAPGFNSQTFFNAGAGTIVIAVTDFKGCFAQATLNVTQPAMLTPGTIDADQVLCSGDNPAQLTETVPAAGGPGAYSYQWQYGSTAVGPFINIAGATGVVYTPVAGATNTLYYRRMITSGFCIPVYSNVVEILVHPKPVAILSGGETICPSQTSIIKVNMMVGTGPYELDIDNHGTVTGYVSGADIVVSPVTTTTYRLLRVRDANGCEVLSPSANLIGTAVVTVRALPVITTSPANKIQCEYGMVAFNVVATGSDLTYQWYVNTGSGFNPVADGGVYFGATNSSLSLFGVTRSMNGFVYHAEVTGCSSTVTSADATLTVNTAPEISVQPKDTTACMNAGAAFTVNAAGTGITYQWQVNKGTGFNNVVDDANFSGSALNTLTITNTQAAFNNYVFRVIISGTCGIPVYSNFAVLRVNIPPVVSLNPVSKVACDGTGPVLFIANGSGMIDSLRWQVFNGGVWADVHDNATYSGSTSQQLTILSAPVALTGNQYRLSLKAKCTVVNTTAATLTVNPNPVVDFSTINPINACGSVPVIINGNPTGGSGTWSSHLWTGDVGPLSNYFVQSPTFNTQIAGTYALNYRVRDNNGCFGNGNLTVNVDAPDATFTQDKTNGCTPATVNFTKDMTGIAKFWWDFGDGSPKDSVNANPVHTFTNASPSSIVYNDVKLTVRSPGGCLDSFTSSITVYPAIDATFTASPAIVCSSNQVVFTTLPGASKYFWDFGDGVSGYFTNSTNHLFTNLTTAPIVRTVTLTTTSFYNCVDVKTLPVTVMPVPLPQFIGLPVSQPYNPAGNPVTFTNTTNPGTWTWLWSFGDGATSTDMNPVHTYTVLGTFNVVLKVTNANCADSVKHTVSVTPLPPVASFDLIPSGCSPWTINLNNTSLNTNTPGTTYMWDFGDGTSSTAKNPSYTYFTPGQYRVELIVTGPGGTSNVSQVVNAYASPLANFSVSPTVVFANDQQVRCFNLTQGADSYLWEFGDGDTSKVSDPYHKYMEEGTYDITLWAYLHNVINNETIVCSDKFVLAPAVTVEPAGTIRFSTVFTPNTSGEVDMDHLPTGQDIDQFFFPPIREKVIDYKLQIFNRLGVLIFESHDINRPWNGYYHNKLCQQGVYVWYVEGKYANGQPFKKVGDITLLH